MLGGMSSIFLSIPASAFERVEKAGGGRAEKGGRLAGDYPAVR